MVGQPPLANVHHGVVVPRWRRHSGEAQLTAVVFLEQERLRGVDRFIDAAKARDQVKAKVMPRGRASRSHDPPIVAGQAEDAAWSGS